MKILYGVQGTGNGHVTRARALNKYFHHFGIHVDFLFSGREQHRYFTESWEMASQALDLGYYISISGIVTFRNADELREVAKKIPIDRLLVETDSPYLAPVPFRGKSNQPRYVRAVAEYVADLRGMSLERLAEQTTANFFRLFTRAQA